MPASSSHRHRTHRHRTHRRSSRTRNKRASSSTSVSAAPRGIFYTLVTAFRTLRTYIVGALRAARNSAPVRALATVCSYVVRTCTIVLKALFAPVLAAGYLVRYASQAVVRTLSAYIYTLMVIVLTVVAWLYGCTPETLENWAETSSSNTGDGKGDGKGEAKADDNTEPTETRTSAKQLQLVIGVLRTQLIAPLLHKLSYSLPQFTYIVLRIWHLMLVEGVVHLADLVVRVARSVRTFLTGIEPNSARVSSYADKWTQKPPEGTSTTLEQHYAAAKAALHKQVQIQTKKGFVPLLTDALTVKLFAVPTNVSTLFSGAWKAHHTYKTYNKLATQDENVGKTSLWQAWRTMKRTFSPVQRIAEDAVKQVVQDDRLRTKMHEGASRAGKTVGDTVSNAIEANNVWLTSLQRAQGVTDAQLEKVHRKLHAEPTVLHLFQAYFACVATAGAIRPSTGRVVVSRLPQTYRPVKDTLPIFLNS